MPSRTIRGTLQGIFEKMLQDFSLAIDDLLHTAIRMLTTTPAPLPDIARQGVILGLFLLLFGLIARYIIGVRGSFTVNPDHEWRWVDTGRVVAALAGLYIYYRQVDVAYSILNTVTTPLGGGDALLTAVQFPAVIDGGLIAGLIVALTTAEIALMAALVGALRVLVIMGILPIAAPVLTAGVVLRAPPVSGVCRGLLRRLRWLVYAGFSAAVVVQIGSVVTTFVSGSDLELAALLVALATVNVAGLAIVYTFSHGPKLEQWLLRGRYTPLPAPDGQQPQNEEDDDRDTVPESQREVM